MAALRPMHRDEVPSPCVNVCVMDETAGLCRGCRRTLAEIARWSTMSSQEKRGVLALIEQRRDASASSPSPSRNGS